MKPKTAEKSDSTHPKRQNESTRERVLEAAFTLFCEGGFSDVRMLEIGTPGPKYRSAISMPCSGTSKRCWPTASRNALAGCAADWVRAIVPRLLSGTFILNTPRWPPASQPWATTAWRPASETALRLIGFVAEASRMIPGTAQRPNPLGRRDAEVEADDLGVLPKEGGEHVVILNEAAIDLPSGASVGSRQIARTPAAIAQSTRSRPAHRASPIDGRRH
jgi:hypothetical protein